MLKINRSTQFVANFLKLSIGNILRINLMGERIEDIYNFIQLSERIATAGQPSLAQYPAIVRSGYQVVINLALTESLNALPNESEIAANLGLDYVHIPVLWDAPNLADFQKFVDVMNANADRQIFVHCAANMRVSAFMYLYRRLNDRVDEGIAKRDLAKIWEPNEVWQTFIDRVSTDWRSSMSS